MWIATEPLLTKPGNLISLHFSKEKIMHYKGDLQVITGTISSKGQVTIPKKIREFLGVGKSDKIAFIPLEEGKVIITSKPLRATELFGMLKHRRLAKPVSVDEIEEAIKKQRNKRAEKRAKNC